MKKFLLVLICLTLITFGALAENSFKPGTYTATEKGFIGDVTVEVVLSADRIESVKIVASQETPEIAGSALTMIPEQIIAKQSLDIDSVTGATYASNAILSAVADCIRQAGTNPDALAPAVETEFKKTLTPGTYQATRHGHHGDITVEVELTEDSIASVKVTDTKDSMNISDLAAEVIPAAVVSAQSVNVDTVAGATYSSRAILSAIEDCIVQAGGNVLAFSEKAASKPWSNEEISAEYDVVVVGSGMSGLAAAMAAQDGGAKVAIIEKLPYFGGVSQTSYGFFIGAANEGKDTESMEKYLTYRFNANRQGDTYMGGEYPHLPSVKVFAENSYNAMKWMESKGSPLFYVEAPLRRGEPKADGGADLALSPITYAQFASGVHEPNVAWLGMEKLFNNFFANGGDMYLETRAESLITDENGTVVGVKATGKKGQFTFHTKAVVLCTGGFGANPEMIAEIAPAYKGERNVTLPGNTGDGIRMALEVGAVLYDDQYMMGGSGQVVITDADMISGWKDNETPKSCVEVDMTGMRINSEDPESYSNSTIHTNPDSRDYYWVVINEEVAAANLVLHDIYDPESVTGTYKDLLDEQIAAGTDGFYKADSIAELAKKMSIVPVNLMYTMNRYNSLCEKGEDTDLFKNPAYLVPMTEGPWYAAKAYMTYFGTVGGIKTDENAAVLNAEGLHIPGLYAAGETSNHNLFNLSYLGAFSMGECLTFGRIAGTNAAVFANAD